MFAKVGDCGKCVSASSDWHANIDFIPLLR